MITIKTIYSNSFYRCLAALALSLCLACQGCAGHMPELDTPFSLVAFLAADCISGVFVKFIFIFWREGFYRSKNPLFAAIFLYAAIAISIVILESLVFILAFFLAPVVAGVPGHSEKMPTLFSIGIAILIICDFIINAIIISVADQKTPQLKKLGPYVSMAIMTAIPLLIAANYFLFFN